MREMLAARAASTSPTWPLCHPRRSSPTARARSSGPKSSSAGRAPKAAPRVSPYAAGRDLQPLVQAIGEWGATWSFTDPRPRSSIPTSRSSGWPATFIASDSHRTGPWFVSTFATPSGATAWCLSPPRSRSAFEHPVSTSTSRSRRHRHALPRRPRTGRARRRDPGRPADDERRANAATRIRRLFTGAHPPRPAAGAGALHSRLAYRRPPQRVRSTKLDAEDKAVGSTRCARSSSSSS